MDFHLCIDIDNSFGPYAGECRGGFDFTQSFEEIVLTLLPVAALLVLASFRIHYLLRKQIKVTRNWRLVFKLVSLAISNDGHLADPQNLKVSYIPFVGLQLALLVLWKRPSAIPTITTIPTAVLALAAGIVLPLLSYAEHQRTLRPSSLLGVYLFSTLLFDIARARTLWLQGYNRTIAVVTTASVVVKLELFLLESVEKRRILLPEYIATSPPEATAGLFNRLFFIWLNGLFRLGFSKYLKIDDLFILDKHLSSEYLENILHSAWIKG